MDIKHKIILISFLISGILFIGCGQGKEITINKINSNGLNEAERREYNYALTEATKQKLFGNLNQAALLYEKCIKVNKNSDVAYYQLGNIKMLSGDYNDALVNTKKAVELNKLNFWYLFQLAQLYVIKNQNDSVKIIFQDIIKYWPDKIEIQYELARVFSEDGEYDKALKILNKIESDNGISEPVSLMKEQIYMKTGYPDLAVEEILKLLKLLPEEIRYLGILAELYNSINRNKEAEDTYEKIFKIDPENVMALLSYAEFLRNIGETEQQFEVLQKVFEKNNVKIDQKLQVIIDYLTDENGLKIYNKEVGKLIDILIKNYPEDYKVRTAYADYLVKNNKYSEALKEYEYVLSVEKSNYFIWEQVIFIENMLDNVENVYNKSGEGMKYFPDRPLLYLFRGNASMRLGKNDEAAEILEKGVEKVKNNNDLLIQFYSFLAETYRTLGNDIKSDEYFEHGLELDPENLLLLNNYSYYLSLRGKKLEQAEKMSKKTIIAEPENSTYLDTYSWVLFKSGNYKKALEFIKKAEEFGGSQDPEILEHYGDILDKLGKREEALKYWKLSLEKGNKNKLIIEKIEMTERNE